MCQREVPDRSWLTEVSKCWHARTMTWCVIRTRLVRVPQPPHRWRLSPSQPAQRHSMQEVRWRLLPGAPAVQAHIKAQCRI